MSTTPNSNIEISNVNLDEFENRVVGAVRPEEIRDILFLIYDELAMRRRNERWELTGFERATYNDLRHMFYRAVNQMIIMWVCALHTPV
jgi:hypothetical protein